MREGAGKVWLDASRVFRLLRKLINFSEENLKIFF